MPLYSNYNILAVCSNDKTYQVGDIFKCPLPCWSKFGRFNGLKIINIDYSFHKRLWFDFDEWGNNHPQNPVSSKITVNKIYL